ncbi:fructose-6-phosphate aldolase [Mycoplasma sp. P36-A1]|uniref:fructose-6-phosphate aldolase n=1 Tax=Mycoplasma sp. P36-A1 TaxID=3252900 RepID=UPI003C301A20
MKFFIDTANLEDIKEISKLGFICGVTTNPSLIAKEGKDFKTVVKEITQIVDGPISAEVVSTDAHGMIEEGKQLALIHPNIVIKVPITPEGLTACSQLAKEGIKVNVTLIFSANQALMAARANAAFVSPFVGRLDDIGQDGINLIEEVSDIFTLHNIQTEIIAASIRNPIHVTRCALAGADIATIPTKVFKEMFNHPLTTKGLENFEKDWKNAFEK